MEISENNAGIDKGSIGDNKGEIVVYQPDEITRLEVRLKDETAWLNRQQIALLFGRDVKTIGKHINNALTEELSDVPTVANFAIVQQEGAVGQPTISKHLKNIFSSGELNITAVHSILEYTAADGKTYMTQFYNLDMNV